VPVGLFPSKDSEGGSFQASPGFWFFVENFGFSWFVCASPQAPPLRSHDVFSLYLICAPVFPLDKWTNHSGLIPNSNDLILTWLSLSRPCFQIYCEILEITVEAYILWAQNSTHNRKDTSKTNTCNSSMWEVEAGDSWVQSQPGLHSETLSQKSKQNKQKN
jgi:hypothetical protein